jgi:polyhydroxyalkanoate synthesis regulator phasin
VRAPEKLERLASKVVEGKLSVQKLRTLVQKEQEKAKDTSGRGRKRSPEVLKAIEACLRVLRDEETGKLLFHRSDVTEMTDEQQAKADAALRSLEKRVAELRRILS